MRIRVGLALMVVLALAACSDSSQPSPTLMPTAQVVAPTPAAAQPTVTPSPIPPTPTSTPEPPAAARVNGQIITLEQFQRELARYEAARQALSQPALAGDQEYQAGVLDALIEQVLVEQAAAAEGLAVSAEEVEAELQRLIQTTGGEQAFSQWLEANQYLEDEFRAVLRAQMITQAMIGKITAQIGSTAEQVHARHIVVDSRETAEAVLTQLQNGVDMAALAAAYSLDESTRQNGGDLGFFPRGLLLAPEVEEAAFSLPVGVTSDLVESGFGIHIVQVLEKDPARPLTPEMQQRLRAIAFESWLRQLWENATVERTI